MDDDGESTDDDDGDESTDDGDERTPAALGLLRQCR